MGTSSQYYSENCVEGFTTKVERDEFYRINSRFHGASVQIYVDMHYKLVHYTVQAERTVPTVRSYKDGLRVGCAFITNEAFEKLYKLHKNFLDQKSEKVHQ